jgi:cytochrome b subunit of formate dehydrogenase
MAEKLGNILVDARVISKTTLERALERQRTTGRKLGEVLEDMGVIWQEDISEALQVQSGAKSAIPRKLGDILVEANIISMTTLERSLIRQKETDRKLGEVMSDMGVVSQQEISVALSAQKSATPHVPKKFGEILVEAGLISKTTLMRALERQREIGKILGDVLEEMGVITQAEISEALAVQNGKLEALLADPHRQYRRFNSKHIFLHIMVITSFLGLSLTGLPLKFSDQGWAKILMSLYGGAENAGQIHRFCAVLTFVYFAAALAMSFHFLFIRKDLPGNCLNRLFGPESLCPNFKDVRDVIAMVKWFVFKGQKPTFDRWTYWEKFDFLAVFWGMFAIGGSGLMLWFPEFFGSFLPGWSFNVATIIHSDEALLATGFIFSVHFFNTHGRPEKFPMDFVIFNGQLDKHEFMEERGEQWHRYEKLGILHNFEVRRPSGALYDFLLKGFGFTALFTGLGLLLLMILAFLAGSH